MAQVQKEERPAETPAESPQEGPKRVTVARGLESVRRGHEWVRTLGELGIVAEFVLLGLLLVFLLDRVAGVDQTAVLLAGLLLPPIAYLVVRRPEAASAETLARPFVAFRGWLGTRGEVATVVELGLLGLFCIWFTHAFVGVESVPLLAIEFVLPQLVYLVLTRRSSSD